MIKVPVNFKQTDEVLDFVRLVNQYPFQMDLVSGKHVVDAKSLMGTLANSRADGLSLMIHTSPSQSTEKLLMEMNNFTQPSLN